jgi:hypothetical protein
METKTPVTEERSEKKDMVFCPVPPTAGTKWPFNRGPKKFGTKKSHKKKNGKLSWREDL